MDKIYWIFIFWAIALAASIFYAACAFKIFLVDTKIKVVDTKTKDVKEVPYPKSWFLHQRWFRLRPHGWHRLPWHRPELIVLPRQ